MLLDANLLLYAVDADSKHNSAAAAWLDESLNGANRVGLPWQTIGAFLRIVTHPRATENPLTGSEAWGYVADWLAVPVVWIPPATASTAQVYAAICAQADVTGNLVPDAQLAALAIEHGLELASADSDFQRFPGLRWINPLEGKPHR